MSEQTRLAQYVQLGVDERPQDRLPQLIALKYHSRMDGIEDLGGTDKARVTFFELQKQLYRKEAEQVALRADVPPRRER